MEASKNFQELVVWQKAHNFVIRVYLFTKTFPREEIYGLTTQLRRAAISIAANVAEGFKKQSAKDKIRFLNISQGSAEESKYYLILSKDLHFGDDPSLLLLIDEIGKLLNSYIKSIRINHNIRTL